MNYIRLIAYSLVSFLVCSSCTYVFNKKVLGVQSKYMIEDYVSRLPKASTYGVSLRNEWVDEVKSGPAPVKAAIAQAVFDTAVADPNGKYIYYTKQDPKPISFSKDLSNYVLYRWEIGTTKDSRILELGHVPGFQIHFGPVSLRPDGKPKRDPRVYVTRMQEDTDGDGKITLVDKPSVWSCTLNGEDPKKICELGSGEYLLRVSEGERLIAVSTQQASEPKSYLALVATGQIVDMPAGYEIEFPLYEFDHFILSKCGEDGVRRYYWYFRKGDEIFEINIDPAFLKSGSVSLVSVKDIRDKIMYLQKVEDGPQGGKVTHIYQIDLGAKPEKGMSLKPVLLTPVEHSCQFFASSTNKFVFYRMGSGEDSAIYVVPPGATVAKDGTAVKLIDIGENAYELLFSDSFEYLTYIKHFDSDEDGLVLRSTDKAEIYYLKTPRGK